MKKSFFAIVALAFILGMGFLFNSCNNDEDAQKDAQDELNEMMKGVEEAVKNIDTTTVPPNMEDTTHKKVDKTVNEIK